MRPCVNIMLLLMCFSRNVVLEKYYISTVLRRVKRLWDCPNFIKLGYVFQDIGLHAEVGFWQPIFYCLFHALCLDALLICTVKPLKSFSFLIQKQVSGDCSLLH